MKTTIYAGDSINESIILADYPANEGWALKVRFAPQAGSGAALTVDATVAENGADYDLLVPAASTADWTAGKWSYAMWVVSGAERYTVETGIITVQANLATAETGIDLRSHAKKTLDALEAMIEGKAGRDVQSYSINGRQLQHYSIPDLIMLRDKYRAEYANEQRIKSGNKTGGRKIYVRI